MQQRAISKRLSEEEQKEKESLREIIESNVELCELLQQAYVVDDLKIIQRTLDLKIESISKDRGQMQQLRRYIYKLIDSERIKNGKGLKFIEVKPKERVLIPQGFLGIYEYKREKFEIRFMATYGLGPCVALTFQTEKEDVSIGVLAHFDSPDPKKVSEETKKKIADYIGQAYEKIKSENKIIGAVIISSIEHAGLDRCVESALNDLGFEKEGAGIRKVQILLDRNKWAIDIAMDITDPDIEHNIYTYEEQNAPKARETAEEAFNIPKKDKFTLYQLNNGDLIEQRRNSKVFIKDGLIFLEQQPVENSNQKLEYKK